MPPDLIDAEGGSSALATLANAFTRVQPDDEPLFRHLGRALVLMSPATFDAETLALVCNAFSRHHAELKLASSATATRLQRSAALMPARLRQRDAAAGGAAAAASKKPLAGFNNKTGAANVDGANLRLSVLFSDSVIEGLDPARIDSTSARELSREFQASLDALSDAPTYPASEAFLPERRDLLFQGVKRVDPAAPAARRGQEVAAPSDQELKELWDSFAAGVEAGPPAGEDAGQAGSVFEFMAQVLQEIPPEDIGATSQALLANAFTKTLGAAAAAAALDHLAAAVVATDTALYDDQNLANLVNAYAREQRGPPFLLSPPPALSGAAAESAGGGRAAAFLALPCRAVPRLVLRRALLRCIPGRSPRRSLVPLPPADDPLVVPAALFTPTHTHTHTLPHPPPPPPPPPPPAGGGAGGGGGRGAGLRGRGQPHMGDGVAPHPRWVKE